MISAAHLIGQRIVPRILKTFAAIWLTCISILVHAQADVDWYENLYQVRRGQVDQTLASRTRELKAAKDERDFERQATLLNECAVLHLTRTFDYGSAMDSLIHALKIEKTHGLTEQQLFTRVTMSRVFAEINSFEKSRDYLNSAMKLAASDDITIQAFLWNELGEVSISEGNLTDARQHFQKILDYDEDLKKEVYRAKAMFNLGLVSTLQIRYKDGLQFHRQGLDVFRSLLDRADEARSLNKIAELHRLMKNVNKAIENHGIALKLRKELGDRRAIAETYNNLGRLYLEQKDFPRAIENLQLALNESLAAQDRQQLSVSYEYLSECFESMQNYQQALKFKKDYLAIRELVQGEINEQGSIETQNKYELGLRQNEISALENERIVKQAALDKADQQRTLLIAFTSMVVVILLLALLMYFDKRRSAQNLQVVNTRVHHQNTELQELNATKDKFFSIISHDLKGPLNSLTSFSNLLINHTDTLTKEEIRMLATDFDKSLKNLFALLENLLEWSRSQTGNVDFTPEKFDLTALLRENETLLARQASDKRITIDCVCSEQVIVVAHKNSISTVIRNLLSNAIKFTAPGGVISLSLNSRSQDVIVAVRDNGVGMPASIVEKLFRIDSKHSTKGTANEKGTGLGLILCKEFVEKNNGRLWVESEEGKGSLFSFSLPRMISAV